MSFSLWTRIPNFVLDIAIYWSERGTHSWSYLWEQGVNLFCQLSSLEQALYRPVNISKIRSVLGDVHRTSEWKRARNGIVSKTRIHMKGAVNFPPEKTDKKQHIHIGFANTKNDAKYAQFRLLHCFPNASVYWGYYTIWAIWHRSARSFPQVSPLMSRQ